MVEGLIKALARLQDVIAMITAASDAAVAKASLQVHLDLSDRQADAVLRQALRQGWRSGGSCARPSLGPAQGSMVRSHSFPQV